MALGLGCVCSLGIDSCFSVPTFPKSLCFLEFSSLFNIYVSFLWQDRFPLCCWSRCDGEHLWLSLLICIFWWRFLINNRYSSTSSSLKVIIDFFLKSSSFPTQWPQWLSGLLKIRWHTALISKTAVFCQRHNAHIEISFRNTSLDIPCILTWWFVI